MKEYGTIWTIDWPIRQTVSSEKVEDEINGKTYINNHLVDFRNRDEIKLVPGWGHYLPLGDGWYAGFDYHRPISDSSKVLFVFKYKFSEPE